MRYYRQLAISLENRIKPKYSSSDTGVTTSSSESLPTEKELLKSNPVDDDKPATDLNVVEQDHIEYDDSSSDASHEPSNSFTFAESNTLSTLERSHSFTLAESNISGTRERRNSYTLETPSPVLLDYIRSLQDKQGNDGKSHDIFVDKQTDTEPSTPTIAEDRSRTEPAKERTRRKLWDTDLPFSKSAGSATHSVSLPNSNFVSPTKPVKRSYKSDDGLVYSDDYLSNEDREYIEKIELQSAQNDSNTADDITPTKCSAPFSDNDSFVKDFNLLDISVLSRDTDVGRESTGTFSDCSSVSLNKFMPSMDKKSTDCGEAEQEAFLYFKEQLKLKHRQQLASLLVEQQREHDMLKEQFLKISRTSSCVRSSPPSTPSAVYSHDTYTKKSPNKRTVLDDSISIQLPIPNSSSSPKKKSSGVNASHKMHRAACKIQSGVRGYFTRRLFKTNRVILLVQTIKDCLFTAVSLQNESNLGLSELNLQNRLLQQVILI